MKCEKCNREKPLEKVFIDYLKFMYMCEDCEWEFYNLQKPKIKPMGGFSTTKAIGKLFF